MRLLAPVLSLAVLAVAHSDLHAHEEQMSFVGRTIVISYDSGLEVRAHYQSATQLTWEALTGPSKGQRGTETIHVAEVAPEVFFISWLENKGVSVSNVVDFRSKRVVAFATFDAGQARQAMFDKGALKEVVR